MSSDLFDLVGVKYSGGPAFFLIFNSMIFRVPLSWKPAIAKVALPLERVYNAIPFHLAHASFLAAWRRI
jgi:hypothetical protein